MKGKMQRIYRARVLSPSLDPIIEPLDATAITTTHVTYINNFGRETRSTRYSENVGYFATTKECREFITKYIQSKINESTTRADAYKEQLAQFNENKS